ncbi:MAG: MAPEG family protein [Gammaproteobacteria bacterium]
MLAIITALYGAFIALLAVVTALSVVKIRRREKIGLGDGGNAELVQAMRVHANLLEYAPISLLLLLFLELNQADTMLLHVCGTVLVVSRAMHVWGFSRKPIVSVGRVYGTLATLINIVVMSLANAFLVLRTI